MLMTIGKLEKRMPLSIRSKAGRLDCSTTCLDDLDFGLLLLLVGVAVVPAARAVAAAAAAAAEDLDAERDEECFCTPPVALEDDGLREGGFVPGANGFFLGGAIICKYVQIE